MAEPTQLSWQAAYWGLVPVALNAMTLPSGRVLDLPSSWNFALRSSPAICAFAPIYDIGLVIWASVAHKSLRRGLTEWKEMRFCDESGDTAEVGSLDSLRRNKWTIGLLFVLGALPQAIKIFATQGIPLTKMCCAAYLATFLLDGALLILADSTTTQQPGPANVATVIVRPSSMMRSTNLYSACATSSGVVVLTHIGLFTLAGDRGQDQNAARRAESSADAVWLNVALCSFLVFFIDSVLAGFTWDHWERIMRAYICFAFALTMPSLLIWRNIPDMDAQSITGLLILTSLSSPALCVSFFIWENIMDSDPAVATTLIRLTDVDPTRRIGKCFFASSHLVLSFICYRRHFSPASTYKPEWTNWLGSVHRSLPTERRIRGPSYCVIRRCLRPCASYSSSESWIGSELVVPCTERTDAVGEGVSHGGSEIGRGLERDLCRASSDFETSKVRNRTCPACVLFQGLLAALSR